MKKTATTNEVVKVGTYVAIHRRLCSDKVQPDVVVGRVLIVEKVGQTASGAVRLICREHPVTCKGETPRRVTVNADRFEWMVVTEEELGYAVKKAVTAYKQVRDYRMEQARKLMEQKFQEEAKRTTRALVECMTWDEHVKVTIIPLIVTECAWIMAEECCRYCASEKISQVLKVTRGIKHLREEYLDFLHHDLRRDQTDDLRQRARELMESDDFASNMMRFRLTLENEYFRQFNGIDIPYLPLRVTATLGVIFIAAYSRRVEMANELIHRKAKGQIQRGVNNPLITDRLYAQFDALLGDFVLKGCRDIDTIEGVIDRFISEVRVMQSDGIATPAQDVKRPA